MIHTSDEVFQPIDYKRGSIGQKLMDGMPPFLSIFGQTGFRGSRSIMFLLFTFYAVGYYEKDWK